MSVTTSQPIIVPDQLFFVQELFTVNHHLLNALGVGHVSLDRVCHLLAEFGLAAKLTGGGGGGCAIALLSAGLGVVA